MENKVNNSKKVAFTYSLCFFVILAMVMLGIFCKSEAYTMTNKSSSFFAGSTSASNKKHIYLSDVPYLNDNSSAASGHAIHLDENDSSGMLRLKVDGESKPFIKGICAWASSTIVYDLNGYDYDYFTSYIGVDIGEQNNYFNTGVKFYIYTSNDGENWNEELVSNVFYGWSEAQSVKIDIKGKRYLKLFASSNSNNWWAEWYDEATYADAKLIKSDYVEDTSKAEYIKTIEEYDNIIKKYYGKEMNEECERALLQRQLVKNIGYDIFQSFIKVDESYKETVSWLMNDIENMRLYILGGAPSGGNYLNSLKVLSRLYAKHKDDFKITKKTASNVVLGDLYKKMAITLSLTHSTRVGLWMNSSIPENQSDAVTRYEQFKKLYDEKKFVASSTVDITPWFENYTVEEMRFVLNTNLDDESVFWLNDYTQSQIDANPNRVWTYLTPHPYMAYVWPNYANEVFHDQNRKDYWDEKFNGIFSKYGVSYSTEDKKIYKVWMNFRNEFGTGAVCGGISKTGANIRAVNGIACAVIGQPGHAAMIYYTRNSEGKGYWSIDNDVSGWALSEKGERLLLSWGNDKRYVKGYNVSYIAMAQEAVNRFNDYQKSAELFMMADVYNDAASKKEEYLRKSLEEIDFNVDSWYSLIELYNQDSTKKEEDYFNLAKELRDHLLEYPLPFYNLVSQLEPKFTSNEYKFKYSLLVNDTLTKGKEYKGNDVLQPGITRTVANYLLGTIDTKLAKFSFDGEDAGKIILSDKFDGSGVRFDYSLNGKKKWTEVSFTAEEEHKVSLTEKEIASITAEDDIYVHIVGTSYDEENIFKIDIIEPEEIDVYANDLENRIIGANDLMEWRYTEKDPWTSYKDASPNLVGDKTVIVRQMANGVKLQSNSVTLTYTKDIVNEKKTYIPVAHLSIENVSSEATSNGGNASYIIDANPNTRWHSAWNGTDTERYITIKFDKEVMLSAMDYLPAGGGNGKILTGEIYGSLDGEVFTKIETVNWANNEEMKTVEFENPTKVKYVKIVGTNTSSASSLKFIAGRMLNFYQDITNSPEPTTGLEYSTEKPTNKDVTVRIVNPSTPITITNNNGSEEYVFKKNGEFTFEFVDEFGKEGKTTAKVNWIDKTIPTATVDYNVETETNKEVIAKIKFSEEVTILTENIAITKLGATDYQIIFEENGEVTIDYQDKAGNKSNVTVKVDWISKEQDVPSNPVSPVTPPDSSGENNGQQTQPNTPPTNNVEQNNNNSSSNNAGSDNPGTSQDSNPNTINGDTTTNIPEGDSYSYSAENVQIKIYTKDGAPTANAKLVYSSLDVDEKYKENVGNASEFFKLSLENENNEKVNLSDATMVVQFKLDSSKTFKGLYKIKEDGSLEKADYSRVSGNKIEINEKELGEYILSYDKKVQQSQANNSSNNQTEDSNSIITYIIIVAALIIFITIMAIIIRKISNR